MYPSSIYKNDQYSVLFIPSSHTFPLFSAFLNKVLFI